MATKQVWGRYLTRSGQWSDWMKLDQFGSRVRGEDVPVQAHDWGGFKFQTKFVVDDCAHQWMVLDQLGYMGRLRVWCPNCDTVRVGP